MIDSSDKPKPAWRRFLKRIAPLRRAYAGSMSVWGDLRLYLLALVGSIPSHAIRNFFYRRAGVKLARTSSIHAKARFFCPEGLRIGHYSTIGDRAFLDGREGITIGDCVNIAADLRIYTREHDIDSPDFAEVGGPVVIEDYVYIGTRAMILPGVRIGRGAVVASGAVVTKDVPPFILVGGVPARAIRERSRDLRYKVGYAKRFH
jgi:maltose O-acetyltransferase